jgi:hypothetical protein
MPRLQPRRASNNNRQKQMHKCPGHQNPTAKLRGGPQNPEAVLSSPEGQATEKLKRARKSRDKNLKARGIKLKADGTNWLKAPER